MVFIRAKASEVEYVQYENVIDWTTSYSINAIRCRDVDARRAYESEVYCKYTEADIWIPFSLGIKQFGGVRRHSQIQ